MNDASKILIVPVVSVFVLALLVWVANEIQGNWAQMPL